MKSGSQETRNITLSYDVDMLFRFVTITRLQAVSRTDGQNVDSKSAL